MLNNTITAEIMKSLTGAVRAILHTSHPSDIADCAQDAVVRILSSMDSFDATRGDFGGWCHIIARNVAKNWRKASANRGHDSEGFTNEDGDATPLVDTLIGVDGRAELARAAEAQMLAAAVATLDDDDRAFVEGLIDGLGQTEAGAILGWSAATASRKRKEIAARITRRLG